MRCAAAIISAKTNFLKNKFLLSGFGTLFWARARTTEDEEFVFREKHRWWGALKT
jgi:hypothetical protein